MFSGSPPRNRLVGPISTAGRSEVASGRSSVCSASHCGHGANNTSPTEVSGTFAATAFTSSRSLSEPTYPSRMLFLPSCLADTLPQVRAASCDNVKRCGVGGATGGAGFGSIGGAGGGFTSTTGDGAGRGAGGAGLGTIGGAGGGFPSTTGAGAGLGAGGAGAGGGGAGGLGLISTMVGCGRGGAGGCIGVTGCGGLA